MAAKSLVIPWISLDNLIPSSIPNVVVQERNSRTSEESVFQLQTSLQKGAL